uniref:Uncharacterized protein n=1 Tax=Ciona intestinalis TaxID=7719 RepID=H2XTC4_CIOIN
MDRKLLICLLLVGLVAAVRSCTTENYDVMFSRSDSSSISTPEADELCDMFSEMVSARMADDY